MVLFGVSEMVDFLCGASIVLGLLYLSSRG
jgi:hypothetical protein